MILLVVLGIYSLPWKRGRCLHCFFLHSLLSPLVELIDNILSPLKNSLCFADIGFFIIILLCWWALLCFGVWIFEIRVWSIVIFPLWKSFKGKALSQWRVIIKRAGCLGSIKGIFDRLTIHSFSIMHIIVSLCIVPFSVRGCMRRVYFTVIAGWWSSTIFIVPIRGDQSCRHVIFPSSRIVCKNIVRFRCLFECFCFHLAAIMSIWMQGQCQFSVGCLDFRRRCPTTTDGINKDWDNEWLDSSFPIIRCCSACNE